MIFSRTLLSTTMLAVASLAPLAASAQPANPFAAPAPAIPAPPAAVTAPANPGASATLRRFNAGSAELAFAGERVERAYPFYVTAAETAQAAQLVLSYQSAVSIMPETSRMAVFINDLPVGETQLGRSGELSVAIPAGVLQPGYNGIRILVDQHHRVDCSIEGTYELWTRIAPSLSGLDFGTPYVELSSLADLPAIARTGTDRMAINLVQSPGRTADLDRAMSVLQATVLLAGIDRPAVTVSGSAGSGPGLDIIIGTPPGGVRPASTRPAVQVAPDVSLIAPEAGGRATLLVGSQITGDIDRTIAALVEEARSNAPMGTAAGLRSLSIPQGQTVSSKTSIPLVDLGLDTREFAGRAYRSEIAFGLPSDFYAADYDAAHITLDAAYAAGLSEDATLIVRANGRQVSSLPLSSIRQGRIEQQTLKVPLSALRPGHNRVTFEATLLSGSDETCEPIASISDMPARFVIGPGSALHLPRVAQMGHLPDMAAMSAGRSVAGDESETLTIYSTGLNAPGLDAAATLLAQIAASSGSVLPVKVSRDVPMVASGDLLAVGTYADLPPALLDQVGLAVPSRLGAKAETDGTQASLSQEEAGGAGLGNIRIASFADAFAAPTDIASRIEELGGWVGGLVSAQASNFLGLGENDAFTNSGGHVPEPASRLVMAQAATPGDRPYAWTVVAAADAAALTAGVQTMAAAANWAQLGGAVTVLHDDGQVVSHDASEERLYETQPRSFGNLRLVFAGWLSRHLQAYVLTLILLALMLGISTRLFLSQVGNRDR